MISKTYLSVTSLRNIDCSVLSAVFRNDFVGKCAFIFLPMEVKKSFKWLTSS